MANKQARLSAAELHEVKQLMGALLAMLSFWSLASLDIGVLPMLLLGGAVAVVAFCFPRSVARIPRVVWRWAGPIILVLISVDFILNIPAFIPPLVRMVVLLIIYRMLAPRNLREDKQVILLCLFCVVISGVLTVSLLFAFQILLFTPLAMALLFVICLLDRGKEASPYWVDWEQFEWAHLIRRVWRVLDLRVLLLCSGIFFMVVVVSSLLFILTPRFDFNQTIPFLELNTKAKSGFSEDVMLGEVSEIQEDNSVALRIDVPAMDAVISTPYWRMLVLDKYSDGRFQVSRSLRAKPFRVFQETRELRSPVVPMSERSGALWTFYMEGGISRYLPLPGDYTALRFQKFQDIELVPDIHVLGLDSVGQNVFSYQVEDLKFNLRFPVGDIERAILETLPLEVNSKEMLTYPLTALELSMSDESVDVLREINRGIIDDPRMGTVAYSQAVTDYLWQHFAYSLKPNGAGGFGQDPIVSWLESGTQGHCELFAGAFILLARQAGYPTRMVVGYAGGTWNTLENYFVVRNRDAHAWVEIFDAEDQTWLRIDPTPGRGSSDPELMVPGSLALESGWSAWVDSLRIQWYRRVVNFEQKDQVELAMTLKDVLLEYYEAFKEVISDWGKGIESLVARPLGFASLRLVALVCALGAGVFFVWRARYSLLGILYRMLRRPEALDPVRRQASRYLARFKAKGIEAEVVLELQALRFGPEQSLRAAKPVFAKAQRALKG
ncbi:transglutaminase family protein [Coraliomargarita sp. W4R53]